MTGPDCAVMGNLLNTYRCTVEAAYDQNVGSREAEGVMEGAGGPMRGRSKSASLLSRLLRGFRDSNTH